MNTTDPIPGVDTCVHARKQAATGARVEWDHVARCPVCLRRWRMHEAELMGWEPLARERAERVAQPMAEQFNRRNPEQDTEEYRGFYAALARDPDLESVFACMVAARLAPAPAPSADFLDRLQQAIHEELYRPAADRRPALTVVGEWLGLVVAQLRGASAVVARLTREWQQGEPVPAFALPLGSLRPMVARESANLDEPVAAVPLALSVPGPAEVWLSPALSQAEAAEQVVLTVRRRDPAGDVPLVVRLYRGVEAGSQRPELARTLRLEPGQVELAVALSRPAFERGRIEIDVLE